MSSTILPPPPQRPASADAVAHLPLHRRRWPWITLAVVLVAAAVSGSLVGRFLRFDLPDVRALEDYRPPVMTRVLSSEGNMVASFAEERRMLIEFNEIPIAFQQALIATEDSNFYSHPGIDLWGIARAAWSDLRHLTMAQGASTLTQQLARNLFLHPKKTVKRKLQEATLALEIERLYSKQEILRYYVNQVYMGHGRYGLEAAARFYFGKSAQDLSLTEAATIAGLIQRPEAISPLRNPERALSRRNHVIGRMEEERFLTEAAARDARESPLDAPLTERHVNPAPYFVEEVRRWLQQKFGSSGLYKEGFEVSTTLDLRLQAIANEAVDTGLRDLDRRQGWRGAPRRVPDGEDVALWEPKSWDEGIVVGAVHDGVVTATDGGVAEVRVAGHVGTLDAAAVAWTGKKSPAAVLKPGDVPRVRVVAIAADGTLELALEQDPEVEAALVALDPATGAVRALVGGFDFDRSEYDRAMQAKRQSGSAFKPFVFAAALGEGWTAADTIVDEPTVFLDRHTPDPYQPENYTRDYYHRVTLRTALEKSANIATVKLLTSVGYRPVIDTARRLGISSDLRPYPSLALGAFEVTLLELTAAYGAFANQGVLVEPHLVDEVRNRDGAAIATIDPEVRDAVHREVAYLMNGLLSGVITDGTGQAAASLGMPLAGKTGTTDGNTDAWFIGYAPDLAVGVWVGFDEPRSLGRRETGAQAALPIWTSFMKQAYSEGHSIDAFPRPATIAVTTIDRRTGLKANAAAGCSPVISELFVDGSEPAAYCTEQHHALLAFPYPFQHFALDERGVLQIPANELDRLLAAELDVFLVEGGTRLEAYTEAGTLSLLVDVLPAGAEPERPNWLRERFDAADWKGLDGRSATIHWLD